MPLIGIGIVLALVGVSLLAMVLFGIRSVMNGKVKPMSMAAVAVPLVLLGVLGMVMQDWPTAAIYTLLIMLALTSLSMLLASLKGLIGI